MLCRTKQSIMMYDQFRSGTCTYIRDPHSESERAVPRPRGEAVTVSTVLLCQTLQVALLQCNGMIFLGFWLLFSSFFSYKFRSIASSESGF